MTDDQERIDSEFDADTVRRLKFAALFVGMFILAATVFGVCWFRWFP